MKKLICALAVLALVSGSCRLDDGEESNADNGSLTIVLQRWADWNITTPPRACAVTDRVEFSLTDIGGNDVISPWTVSPTEEQNLCHKQDIPPGLTYTLTAEIFNESVSTDTPQLQAQTELNITAGEITAAVIRGLPVSPQTLDPEQISQQITLLSSQETWFSLEPVSRGPYRLTVFAENQPQTALFDKNGCLMESGISGIVEFCADDENGTYPVGFRTVEESSFTFIWESLTPQTLSAGITHPLPLIASLNLWCGFSVQQGEMYSLSWSEDSSEDITLYNSSWEVIEDTPESPFTLAAAEDGFLYLRVSGEDPDFSMILTAEGLAPPSNLQASEGDSSEEIQLSWTGHCAADEYIVYRRPESESSFVEIARTTELSFCDTGVPDWQSDYVYTVRAAAEGASDSSPCEEASGYRRIPAPSNVQASDGTYGNGVMITWTAVQGAGTYRVSRSTDGDFSGKSSYAAETENSHCWQTPSTTPYAYGVKAYDENRNEYSLYGYDEGFCGSEGQSGMLELTLE